MWKFLLLFVIVKLVVISARYLDEAGDAETIPCPSCVGERCEGVRVCRYGTFANEMCGNKLDCYKGPGEVCGETVRKLIGRCRPGLQCRCGVCTGHLYIKSFDLAMPCTEFFQMYAGR